MIWLDQCFECSPNVITRNVAGEVILVPLCPTVQEDRSLYTLDETAAFLWNRLRRDGTGRSLVDGLLEHFLVERDQAENDVRQFLSQMTEIGAIHAAAGAPSP